MQERILVAGGSGSWLSTRDGRRLLDATSGLWYANVGHGRPQLAEAAHRQMMKLETHHVFGRFANEPALTLADRLSDLAPFDDARVIFTSGGSDSIETACKLARHHWQLEGRSSKKIILSRDLSYHGLHGFGTSIAGLEANREGYGSASLIPETARVAHSDLGDLARTIDELGADNIAAFIAEPVIGTGGVIPPAPSYLSGAQKLCRMNDILFLVDEVITGFGRVGTMFASERYDISPDMMTIAKGLTSGYLPLGGVLVAPKIWERFWAGEDAPILRQGITYSGHATACAVAEANLDILENESLTARVATLEHTLRDALEPLSENESVVDVRSEGLMAAVELKSVADADQVVRRALEKGVITRVLRGNAIQISPPPSSLAPTRSA